jgi:hypothetical protein
MLFKTDSGSNKQVIQPNTWTWVNYGVPAVDSFTNKVKGTYLWNTILRVEYPKTGCPTTLRGRFVRYPGTDKEDETGMDDKNPVAGLTRHHHWDHFLANDSKMPIGFKVWHDGASPITLDGRQIKSTKLS